MHDRPRVLIVEDIIGESDFLQGILADCDCEAVPALCEAATQLSQSHYDVMLLDLKLADKAPDETLQGLSELLAHSRNPDVGCIVVTAYATSASAWEASQNERIYDYLIKPFAIDHLAQTMQLALCHAPRALTLHRYAAIAARIDCVEHAIPHHSDRVAQLAAAIMQQLGSQEHDIARCRMLGRLHDIGKLGLRQEWEELLSNPHIYRSEDVDDYLEGLGIDKRRRFVQLIPRLFRFEADLGHYYETFLSTERHFRDISQWGDTAIAIAVADAYDVFAWYKGKDSVDDALYALQQHGISQRLVDALRSCLTSDAIGELMRSSLSTVEAEVSGDGHKS